MQLKKELRPALTARRRALEQTEKSRLDEEIFKRLIETEEIKNARTILCYVSSEIEVGTREFLSYCFENGVNVAVPKCVGNEMIFRKITSFSQLETGYKNILEPTDDCAEITDFEGAVCITPALGINNKGYRIGYGKGFYDRFFKANLCFSIGLCYDDFLIDFIWDEFDIPVNMLITQSLTRRIYGQQ